MRWNKFFSWEKIVFYSIFMMFIWFQGCVVEPEPFIGTLTKGTALKDPAVIASGVKFQVITRSGSSIDKNLGVNTGLKPTSLLKYNDKEYNLVRQEVLLSQIPSLSFNWDSTGKKNTMLLIMKNAILVKNNEIANKEDVVWIWTPEMSGKKIDTGVAIFKEGKGGSYQNNKFILSQQNLQVGTYIWFVLAWDDNGLNIVASSREFPLKVTSG